jgi:hypothetical protein
MENAIQIQYTPAKLRSHEGPEEPGEFHAQEAAVLARGLTHNGPFSRPKLYK